jgi:hypothetical protein
MSGMDSFEAAIHKILKVFEDYVNAYNPVGQYYQQQQAEQEDKRSDEEADSATDGLRKAVMARINDMDLKCAKLKRANAIIDAITSDDGVIYEEMSHPIEAWCSDVLDQITGIIKSKKEQEEIDLDELGKIGGEFDADIAFMQQVIALLREGEVHTDNYRTKHGDAVEIIAQAVRFEVGKRDGATGDECIPELKKMVSYLVSVMIDIFIDQAKAYAFKVEPEIPEIARRAVLRSIYRTVRSIREYEDETTSMQETVALVGSLLHDVQVCNNALLASRPLVSRAATYAIESISTPFSYLPGYSMLPALVVPSEVEFMRKYREGLLKIQQEIKEAKKSQDFDVIEEVYMSNKGPTNSR